MGPPMASEEGTEMSLWGVWGASKALWDLAEGQGKPSVGWGHLLEGPVDRIPGVGTRGHPVEGTAEPSEGLRA